VARGEKPFEEFWEKLLGEEPILNAIVLDETLYISGDTEFPLRPLSSSGE
jgi:hypothetical protein